MEQFDALDRKILAALDSSGRISTSDLSRAVKHGRDLVAYRVKRLEETGVFKGVEPIIDPAALGFGLYKTYLSFAQADSALNRVHERLRNHPSIYCAARSHGRWDLLTNAVASSPREFAELRDEVIGADERSIREMGFALFTQMVYFSRKYLKGTPKSWCTMVQQKPHELDAHSRAILTLLTENAGASDVEIGTRAGISPVMVRTRVAQLEKSGVIVGYRARLDRSAFGLSSYKLHISILSHGDRTVELLKKFAASHLYVSQFMTQLGVWPCELNVEAYDSRHLATIIDELRAALGDRIGLVEVTLYDRDEFPWGFGGKKGNSKVGNPKVHERIGVSAV